MKRFYCGVCQQVRRARVIPANEECRRHNPFFGATVSQRLNHFKKPHPPYVKKKKGQPSQPKVKKTGKSSGMKEAAREVA